LFVNYLLCVFSDSRKNNKQLKKKGGEKVREIKFRAWNKKHKIMSQSFSFSSFDGNVFCDWAAITNDELWHSKDMDIMQYTGLKDKNGKKVFEGDIIGYSDKKGIVRFTEYDDNECHRVFRHFGYLVNNDTLPDVVDELENGSVIGNIYENPEIMKGAN
jgi:uncharacterized phage protein (TIGR01671 family)